MDFMRDGGGADAAISCFQPAGPQLPAALLARAAADAIPAILLSDEEEDGDGAADSVAEARATVAYKALLQRTLDGYSTTAAEDRAALAEEGGTSLPPRTQLAMQFRLSQKVLLNTALATASSGGKLVGKSRGFS